jgi:hypothetical protein
MPAVTTQQIRIIHTLLPSHLREAEAKAELVASFTGDDQRHSTKDLTTYEADELIYFLKTGKNATHAHLAVFDLDNRQHRYLLSLCHQLGWVRANKSGRMVADLEALGRWLLRYGYLHKALKDYSLTELPKLVTQLENVLKSAK